MNRILLNIIICTGLMLPAEALALTVSNPAPGALADAVGADTTATTLTVNGGAVNAADFAFIADKMHRLESLDLSSTSIASYAGSTIRMTGVKKSDADVLPPYALIGMKFLSSVSLPKNLTAIGQGAFTGSAIATADVPAKVTSIGENAFRRCENLTEVTLPASLSALCAGAFANCSALKTVTFASGTPLTRLPESAFEGCVALDKINLNALKACTEIGPWAVAHCRSLTAIE
ncbi:MAG: leucine-rich repeat domain-containing protein, partial [Muribaculaceae bacterium]|nr:leucine-rich repeat domain-containing protein [Muribaculaceae bacterium]